MSTPISIARDVAVPNFVEQVFDAGKVSINYAEGPVRGPAVVLLHGTTRNWRSFQSILPALAEISHVFAVDLRGHGKSGRVAGGYDAAGYADDITRFLQERVGEPAVLFGHSASGMASLLVASHHPQNVRGIILGDTALSARSIQQSIYFGLFGDLYALRNRLAGHSVEEMAQGLGEVRITIGEYDISVTLGELPGNDASYLRDWAQCLLQVDPEAIQMNLEGSTLVGYEAEDVLRRVMCPVLLMQANPELGGIMSNLDVQTALPLLARPTLLKLPTSSHALFLITPEPVIEAALQFLGSL